MTVQENINAVNGTLNRTVNAIPEIFIGATFNEIKRSLLNWLAGQNEFKDYDFSGSRLNVLLDVLAYSILYMQQFSNTAIYESFINTANLRSSVVQAAQDNSYLPASKSCAKTGLMLKVSHSLSPSTIKIPRGTKFLAYAKDTSADPYPFVVTEDVVSVRDNKNQYVPIVSVAQGRIVRTQLTFDKTVPIIIRDDDVDRNTFRVYVDGAVWTNWTQKSIVHAGSTSSIFYLRETLDGHTEVYFGEGEQSTSTSSGALESSYIGGLKPIQGSTIVVEYIATSGLKANGATRFTYADTLQYISIDQVIENYTNDSDYVGADGGGDQEDIERIRELAQVKRESQMRCVTASDYDAFVSEKFGSIIQAVQTFTDPSKPGYAFISIKPKSGLYLTAVQKEDIKVYLQDYNLAPITPSVINPNYMFIKANIKVTYALNLMSESEQWLRSKVINQIDRYYTEDVEIFNKSFAKSKMLNYIDNADHSIIGSSASIQLVRELDNYFQTAEAGIKFMNVIAEKSAISTDLPFISGKTTGLETYNVNIISTAPDERSQGQMLLGPFQSGDVSATPYTGTDFNRANVDSRNQYYSIGTINYDSDTIYWNISSIGLTSANFEVLSIELYATPVQDNIFTRDGSLIVFENDLRPDYTNISLEAITQ